MPTRRILALTLCALASALSSSSPAASPSDGAAPVANAPLLSLSVAAPGLDEGVLAHALTSVRCARALGELDGAAPAVVAIIDFSRPSTEERLWVIDLNSSEVLYREHVAHGQATGGNYASEFSNIPSSHQSSIGLFRTAETYHGKHGYSLRLDGLEKGVNDKARSRDIVVHGAAYATDAFIEDNGRLGRSWGCPAVDSAVSTELIDAIKGGAPLFAWYPDAEWRAASRFLSCAGAS